MTSIYYWTSQSLVNSPSGYLYAVLIAGKQKQRERERIEQTENKTFEFLESYLSYLVVLSAGVSAR